MVPGGRPFYDSIPAINIKSFDYSYNFDYLNTMQQTVYSGPVGNTEISVYRDGQHGFSFSASSSSEDIDCDLIIRRLFGFLENMLATAPDTRVGDLDVLTDADRDNITTWSVGEELDIPAGVTLDSLLVDQAHATPTATALIDDATGTELSYAQFTARVNALAGLLADRGVDVGDRVAVAVHRSLDLPVVLAAIIRAGGIYVPVDPEYPAERVSYILADAAPVLLVPDAATTPPPREVFPTPGVPVVPIDAPAVQSVLAPGVSPPPVLSRPLTPADGAYVIYTSGTTGRPKGVAITHHNLVNRFTSDIDLFDYTDSDVILQKTPATFDVSVWEFFLPLLSGATSVVAVDGGHKDPDYLTEVIGRRQITVAYFVASMLQLLLDNVQHGNNSHEICSPDPFLSLRQVFSGGEVVSTRLAQKATATFRKSRFVDTYGPTETTITTSTYIVDHQSSKSASVPIGSPVANTTAHVLDSWLRPVAPGVIGELYLGGAQLADGYVNRHGLTAERFIADPFTDDGNRLYRTGDLVSWNQDGHLDYHGRADDQVKIRGNRIEPDEIRAVVEQHPKVTAAAVIACDHPAGGKFLAAYLTGADLTGDGDITATIRDWVADRLPDYMVPTTVTVLDVLPTTTNGKLDRRALPTPDLGAGSGTGRAPATDTEKTIAAVFTDVLALDDDTELSIDDDFFHLGGHSLLATRITARVNAALGSSLTLKDVFDTPTIGELAALADSNTDADHTTSALPRVADITRPDTVPASYGQQALWLTNQVSNPQVYKTLKLLEFSDPADINALSTAVHKLRMRHEVLRTRFRADGVSGRLMQWIDSNPPKGKIPTRSLCGAPLSSIINEEMADDFELSNEYGRRFLILQDKEKDYLLTIGHHIVSDEQSEMILLRDLDNLYRSEIGMQVKELPPLAVQYADFSYWQEDVIGNVDDSNSLYVRQLAFHCNALENIPAETPLPLDHRRNHEGGRTVRSVRYQLSGSETKKVQRLLRNARSTPLQALLAALALQLWSEGSGTTIPVGVPVNLRDDPDLENVIGYLVNTVALPIRVEEDLAFEEFLTLTRDLLLAAEENKFVPFERVVEQLSPKRELGLSPIFQVMAAYIDSPGRRATESQETAALRPVERAGRNDEKDSDDIERPALFDLVYSISLLPGGEFGLALNAAKELFDEGTAQRLVDGAASFLLWGTEYPHLPVSVLADLVRLSDGRAPKSDTVDEIDSSQGGALLNIGAVDDLELWLAATENLRLSTHFAENLLAQLNKDNELCLVADTENPEDLDHWRQLLKSLVTSYKSEGGLQIVDGATRHHEDAESRPHLILEEPFWEDWVDMLADSDPCEIPVSLSDPSESHSVGPVEPHASTSATSANSSLAAVAGALAGYIGDEEDLVLDLAESYGPGKLSTRPVLVTSELWEESSDPVTLSQKLGEADEWSDARTQQYVQLMSDNEVNRFFDDIPQPTIRVTVLNTDADYNRRTDDGYTVDITVLLPRSTSGDVRVHVGSRAEEIDPRLLSTEVLRRIMETGFSAEEVGEDRWPRLHSRGRLSLPVRDRERIRDSYGSDVEVLPVSPLQSGLLYHMIRAEESDDHNAYISQVTRQLSGDIDTERMRHAVLKVFRRYPNLGAGFIVSASTEVQVIPAGRRPEFRTVDCAEYGQPLPTVLDEERARPFDRENPPLIRFLLVKQEAGRWTLAMTFEHILMDGWSLNKVLAEILGVYRNPTSLDADRPASFRSYLDWLAELDMEESARVWSRYLADIDTPSILCPSLELAGAEIVTGEIHVDLDAGAVEAIHSSAQRTGATVGTVLQTAWGVTLARLTGTDDAIFGNTVAGRPPQLPDAERIIGLLFNTLPFRVRLSPFESVDGLLTRIQREQLDVMEHQQEPLSTIQGRAGLGTLFDTLFVIQNFPFTPVHAESGEAEVLGGTVNDATHYPVTFAVNPWEDSDGQHVHVRMSYRTDAFSEHGADETVDRYIRVLRFMAEHGSASVAEVPAQLPHEKAAEHEIQRVGDAPRDPDTVYDLLCRQAELSPDDLALVAGDHTYSFAEFLDEVNRHARVLLDHGVRPEHRVALLLPRDERMVIAMFAVFAVGAAYVPVDAEHPDDRIAFILETAAPTVTMVTNRDAARIPQAGGELVNLDAADVTEAIRNIDSAVITDGDRGSEVMPDNLAYIIFTSGSTGRPKGVAVGYRGLTNMYVNHVAEIFDRVVAHQGGRRMRIAHTTSFAFDASWEQLFWMLNGHAVYVIDEDMRREPARLLAYYDENRIDGFDVTPSYGEVLVEEGLLDRDRPAGRATAADAEGVVFVSLGGEAVPERLWTQLREAPGVEAYNLYGPTEYTINALGADLADSATSSVGTPILNTRAYILDQNLQPVLPGVPGELYLAGAGMVRGYWRQPSLTAERFPACPFEEGERMYRTGDLVRRRDDGSIEYLGRSDDQVKIRGYRIEPGEIADVLSHIPGVSRAVVVPRKDPTGVIQLFAYLTAGAGASPDGLDLDAIRRRARSLLPDYMVPAGLAAIEEIPLTVNGKVDVRALPEISTGADEHVAPVTPTEKVLVDVLSELMGVETVSTTANFFEIGGNSLMAMRYVAALNDRLEEMSGANVLVRDVFAHQSVTELATVIDSAGGDVQGTDDAILLPLKEASRDGSTVFCVHAQFGSATVYQGMINELPEGWGLVGLQDPSHAGHRVDFADIDEVARAYVDAVRHTQPDGPYHLLGWSYGAHIAFAMAKALEEDGDTVASLTIVDTTPVDHDYLAEEGTTKLRELPLTEDTGLQQEFLERNWNTLVRDTGGLFTDQESMSAGQRTAFAVSGLRCDVMMSRHTTGELDIPTLFIASDRPGDDRADRWRRHLPELRALMIPCTDHYTVMRPTGGLREWAPALREHLKENSTRS